MARTFDSFVKDNWPADVPTDCTRLDGDLDCLDRAEERLCYSCAKYKELSEEFESMHDFDNMVAEVALLKGSIHHDYYALRLYEKPNAELSYTFRMSCARYDLLGDGKVKAMLNEVARRINGGANGN